MWCRVPSSAGHVDFVLKRNVDGPGDVPWSSVDDIQAEVPLAHWHKNQVGD